MTIKNKKAFMEALWDWGFLDECFAPTRIRISDVDGAVERNGHVLFIEAKPPGKHLSTGQSIMFSNLAKSGFTVLVIWGETNAPEKYSIWYPRVANPTPEQPASTEIIQKFVHRWFVWANHMPPKSELDKRESWPVTLELSPVIDG